MPEVTVHSLPGHTYTVESDTGRHTITADEKTSDGGDDVGPTPHELLLTSLGACVAITMRMYANYKQWPLDGVSVHLSIEHVVPSAPDFTPEEIAAAGGDKLPLIRSSVTVKGDLSPEQLARLQEIAGRCPVHRTLRARPAIVTTLAHSA
jgi:putative redox protein